MLIGPDSPDFYRNFYRKVRDRSDRSRTGRHVGTVKYLLSSRIAQAPV